MKQIGSRHAENDSTHRTSIYMCMMIMVLLVSVAAYTDTGPADSHTIETGAPDGTGRTGKRTNVAVPETIASDNVHDVRVRRNENHYAVGRKMDAVGLWGGSSGVEVSVTGSNTPAAPLPHGTTRTWNGTPATTRPVLVLRSARETVEKSVMNANQVLVSLLPSKSPVPGTTGGQGCPPHLCFYPRTLPTYSSTGKERKMSAEKIRG